MFGKMKGNMLAVNNPGGISLQTIVDSSVRKQPYVDALATIDADTMYVMLWNYHDDENKKIEALIKLNLQNLTGKQATVTSYLVDENHSNAYTIWQNMGSPQHPTKEQIHDLKIRGPINAKCAMSEI